MKNRNKIFISGLMALALGLGVSGTTLAYQGDFSKNGPNYTSEFESEITEVMNDGDYEGWKDLMEERVGNTRVTDVINKDNFSKFVQAWKLAREGKIKEANVIRRELGLMTGNGFYNKSDTGYRNGHNHGQGLGLGLHR